MAEGRPIDYRIDEQHAHYMVNWQQQMGLMCTPLSKIYLFAVLYFVMFGIGGFLTFSVMDKLGRRKTCIIFGTGQIMAVTLIMFSTQYVSRLIGFALMGFMMSQKNSLCYAWLFEFMVQRYKVAANTCVNMGDFVTILIVGIVFLYVTPNWVPVFYGLYFAALGGFLGVLFLCPESPKWLLLQGR